MQDGKNDSVKYEYPTATTVVQPNQLTATYESVQLNGSESVSKTNMDETFSNPHNDLQLEHIPAARPVYSEVFNPDNSKLQHNQAYNAFSERTDQCPKVQHNPAYCAFSETTDQTYY